MDIRNPKINTTFMIENNIIIIILHVIVINTLYSTVVELKKIYYDLTKLFTIL